MKTRTQMMAVAVLMFGMQGAAMSQTAAFPVDESSVLAAPDTYADQQARRAGASPWGVSPRDEEPDAFLHSLGLIGEAPYPSKGGPLDE